MSAPPPKVTATECREEETIMTDKREAARFQLPALDQEKATAIDPVCGMSVDPHTATASAVHEGQTYYFCCTHCRERFQADPSRYLGGGQAPQSAPDDSHAPAGAGVEYTCPMHPEVLSDRPGSCPK